MQQSKVVISMVHQIVKIVDSESQTETDASGYRLINILEFPIELGQLLFEPRQIWLRRKSVQVFLFNTSTCPGWLFPISKVSFRSGVSF